MIKKLEKPKVIIISSIYYILLEDYEYSWKIDVENSDTEDIDHVESIIKVPKGFRWDGASIPRFLWKFGLEPDGKHRAAALVHDYIYVYKGNIPSESFQAKYTGNNYNGKLHPQYGCFSRKDSDRLFGRMLREGGVSPLRRKLMFYAVRLFGGIYWQDGPDLTRKSIINFLFQLMLAILFILFVIGLI